MKILKLYNSNVKRFFLIFLMSLFYQEMIYSHVLKDQNEFEELIENWIEKNPDKIRYALEMLKAREEKVEKEKNFLLLSDNSLDPFFGNPNANITIYEFFDYNCGYCKSVLPTLLNVVKKDKNIKLIFKEFPILSETSLEAALYALAAQKQNLYFEFHTRIMEYRGRLNNDIFIKVANDIGLNIEMLKNDLDDKNIRMAIEKNRLIAKGFNINGTPTLIIGDKIIPGAINEQQLNELIKEIRDLNS
tara:strand:+ start:282 stop:1019 length:738 start_codon:yes stop_codon:yes gene_type:complete